jgi:hypothetical protein
VTSTCLAHRRGEPGLDVLPPIPEVAANPIGAWTLALISPLVEALDWDLEVIGYLGRTSQWARPGGGIVTALQPTWALVRTSSWVL